LRRILRDAQREDGTLPERYQDIRPHIRYSLRDFARNDPARRDQPIEPERMSMVERRVRAAVPERPCDDDTYWPNHWYSEARRQERLVDPNAKEAVEARAEVKRQQESERQKRRRAWAAAEKAAEVPARDDPAIRLPDALQEQIAGARDFGELWTEPGGPRVPDVLWHVDAESDDLRAFGEYVARTTLLEDGGNIPPALRATFAPEQVEAFVARYGREWVAGFVDSREQYRNEHPDTGE
jgi:hypothetical protein